MLSQGEPTSLRLGHFRRGQQGNRAVAAAVFDERAESARSAHLRVNNQLTGLAN